MRRMAVCTFRWSNRRGVVIMRRASGKAASVIRKWCEVRRDKYMANEYKAEVTFSTTTMATFMNELTNVTGGNFHFEDYARESD